MFDGFIGRTASLGFAGFNELGWLRRSAGARSHTRCRGGGGKVPAAVPTPHRDVQSRSQRGRGGIVRDGLASSAANALLSPRGGGLMRFFRHRDRAARDVGSPLPPTESRNCQRSSIRKLYHSKRRAQIAVRRTRASAGTSRSVCMKLLVADGQRRMKEVSPAQKIAVWGPSPGFRGLRVDQAGAGGRIHPATPGGESLRSSEKRSRMGILQVRNTGTNQRGNGVFSAGDGFVPRRTPASEHAPGNHSPA